MSTASSDQSQKENVGRGMWDQLNENYLNRNLSDHLISVLEEFEKITHWFSFQIS